MRSTEILNLAALAGSALASPMWPGNHNLEAQTMPDWPSDASQTAWAGHGWGPRTFTRSRESSHSVTMTSLPDSIPTSASIVEPIGIASSSATSDNAVSWSGPLGIASSTFTSSTADSIPSTFISMDEPIAITSSTSASEISDALQTTIVSVDEPFAITSTSQDSSAVQTDVPSSAPVPTTDAASSTTADDSSSSQTDMPSPSSAVSTKDVSSTPSSAATSQPSSSGANGQGYGIGMTDWQKSVLDEHNTVRAKHNATAMTWDSDLTDAAQQAAVKCQFDHFMDLGVGGYGQNLAAGPTTGKDVTDMWYNEVKDYGGSYGHDNPVGDADTGHFTQVVWKASTKLGCATYQCPDNWYTYCNYKDEGNMGGEYAENVQAPLPGY